MKITKVNTWIYFCCWTSSLSWRPVSTLRCNLYTKPRLLIRQLSVKGTFQIYFYNIFNITEQVFLQKVTNFEEINFHKHVLLNYIGRIPPPTLIHSYSYILIIPPSPSWTKYYYYYINPQVYRQRIEER